MFLMGAIQPKINVDYSRQKLLNAKFFSSAQNFIRSSIVGETEEIQV